MGLDAALVLSAHHELNVSTFGARVAASAGANLVACVGAALYAFTGPRHGTASGAVERLLALAEGAARALSGEEAARAYGEMQGGVLPQYRSIRFPPFVTPNQGTAPSRRPVSQRQ